MQCATIAAPRCAGKWLKDYRFIGAQPRSEWPRVEATLRTEFASGRLTGAMCKPTHVADHWADYARGEPPGRAIGVSRGAGVGRRGSGPSRSSTAEEFAAERAAERAERTHNGEGF